MPVSDADYVASESTSFLIDLYAITSTSIPIGSTINSVKVCWRAKKLVAPTTRLANGQAKIKTNGTEYSGTSTALTNSWANYSHTWTTNPFSSSAWTVYDLLALQFGVALKITTLLSGEAECSQVYALISYDLAGNTYIYYHSLNINVEVSTEKEAIYNRYSNLNIDLGIAQQKETVFSRFSDLTILVSPNHFKEAIFSRFSSLQIIIDLIQWSPNIVEESFFLFIILAFACIVAGILIFAFGHDKL